MNSDGHQSNSIAPISEDSRNVNVTKTSSVPNEEKSKNLSDLIHSSFLEKMDHLVPKVIRERVADDDILAKTF